MSWDKIITVGYQICTGDSLKIVLLLIGAGAVCAVMVVATLMKDYAQKISKEGKDDN